MGTAEKSGGVDRSNPIDFNSLGLAVVTSRSTSVTEGLAGHADDLPVPRIDEQIAQQQTIGKPSHTIEIGDAQTPLASVPLLAETRTVRGVPLRLLVTAGEDFFDYLQPPFPNGVRFASLLAQLRNALAKFGADALLLPHLVPPLPDGSAPWQHSYVNQCFDAALAEKGWASLTRRDSLRRHRNRARRELDYRVEHVAGRLPAEMLARIAELHRERWAFDGVTSLFLSPARPAQYMACAERVLLTLIFDGQLLFAAHIGLRFGATMLWHTPVINLRYLGYSPLEVLLLETAEECAREGIQVLDFGLGNESYKDRFSNTTRPVVDLFVPRTWRGYLAHFLLHRTSLSGLRRRLAVVRNRLIGDARPARGCWLFPAHGDARGSSVPPALPELVHDFSRLVDLFRAAHWPLRREHHERLRRGEVFLAMPADAASGVSPTGVWCQLGCDFPIAPARAERHFSEMTATLYDITVDARHVREAGPELLPALVSPDIVRQLVPGAAAASIAIRLPRGDSPFRRALLAAGWHPG